MMLYQVIIAAGLLFFMINVILNLRSLKKPGKDSVMPEPAPLVSVLVPARDEETNIETCLESLRKQDYPNYEILVLDDNSTDNTSNIVSRIAAGDDRVRLVKGEPLPEGWGGKSFACYQLAERASGSWLLFVDADTVHTSDMLRKVIAMAHKLKPSLLSGFPRQLTSSLPQKIVIPVFYFILLIFLPLWWLHRSKEPKPSMAIGQFLLFPREEYWRIGGHEAVKSKILEDVCLGIEVSRHGGRHLAANLSEVVSCNMYRSLGAMWDGFLRAIYSVAGLSLVGLVALLLVGYAFFLAPFYWLWHQWAIVSVPIELRGVIFFQVAVLLIMRWLVDNRFKAPVVSSLLHPIGFSFFMVCTICACFRRAVGAGIQWKEREYGGETLVK